MVEFGIDEAGDDDMGMGEVDRGVDGKSGMGRTGDEEGVGEDDIGIGDVNSAKVIDLTRGVNKRYDRKSHTNPFS